MFVAEEQLLELLVTKAIKYHVNTKTQLDITQNHA